VIEDVLEVPDAAFVLGGPENSVAKTADEVASLLGGATDGSAHNGHECNAEFGEVFFEDALGLGLALKVDDLVESEQPFLPIGIVDFDEEWRAGVHAIEHELRNSVLPAVQRLRKKFFEDRVDSRKI